MIHTQKSRDRAANIFCWIVKSASVAMFLFILAFIIGEGPPNPLELSAQELVMMVCFFAAWAGLITAVWRQGIAGLVILIAMAGFFIAAGKIIKGWPFAVIILIGTLNTLCSLLNPKNKPKT